MFKLKYKKLHPDAKAPTRAHSTDLGFDVYSIEDYTLGAGEQHTFDLGFSIELPELLYMNGYNDNSTCTLDRCCIPMAAGLLFWDKSSVGKKGVKVMGGVVEGGYRGQVSITLSNTSQDSVQFLKGQKLCQMLVTPIILCEAEEVQELSNTERGESGFGSSGAF